MRQVNKKRKHKEYDLKSYAIIGIAVIGLLSLTLIHNAFANEIAFQAVAEKAWKEIVAAHKTQQITQTQDGIQYKSDASIGDGFSNLESSSAK